VEGRKIAFSQQMAQSLRAELWSDGGLMRAPNAIDFWRGYALVCICIDHLPHNPLANFTLKHFALCNAAELFVFLAGWSLSLATGGPLRSDSPSRCLYRTTRRAGQIYLVQVATTAFALAILAIAAVIFADRQFTSSLNAAPIFADPITMTPAWVGLTYQLSYFNILPLYVVLLLVAGPMLPLARRWLAFAMLCSLSLYVTALIFKINLPLWPVDGYWRFNPFCWQFIFMLGFAAAELSADGRLDRWLPRLRVVGVPIVLLGAILATTGLSGELSSLFWHDALSSKMQGPLRLINFLAIAVAFSGSFRLICEFAPGLAEHICSLGRNSLAVFSVGSMVFVIAKVMDVRYGQPAFWAVVFSVIGIAVSLLTAWLAEWPARAARAARPEPSPKAAPSPAYVPAGE
jgi:hypothetical protein